MLTEPTILTCSNRYQHFPLARLLQFFLPAKTVRQSPLLVRTYLAPSTPHSSTVPQIPHSISIHPPPSTTIHHHPLYSISAIRNPHLWTFGPLVSVARANICHPPAHCLSIHHSSNPITSISTSYSYHLALSLAEALKRQSFSFGLRTIIVISIFLSSPPNHKPCDN